MIVPNQYLPSDDPNQNASCNRRPQAGEEQSSVSNAQEREELSTGGLPALKSLNSIQNDRGSGGKAKQQQSDGRPATGKSRKKSPLQARLPRYDPRQEPPKERNAGYFEWTRAR